MLKLLRRFMNLKVMYWEKQLNMLEDHGIISPRYATQSLNLNASQWKRWGRATGHCFTDVTSRDRCTFATHFSILREQIEPTRELMKMFLMTNLKYYISIGQIMPHFYCRVLQTMIKMKIMLVHLMSVSLLVQQMIRRMREPQL